MRLFTALVLVAAGALWVACAGSVAHADPPTAPLLDERPRPGNAFIDSVGVNVHLSYRDGPYGNADRVLALVRNLDVRHLRDGVTLGQTDVCALDRRLASIGAHFDYITQAALTQADLTTWAGCVGPALESFEGINEYDISHPPTETDWARTVRSAQSALYRNVKTSPALANTPVIGPSLTSESAFRTVGDLSSSMNVGNMHNYFAGHEPGTGGWGLNGYGSIAWNVAAARLIAGSHSIMSTENGYSSGGDPKAIDPQAQAVYVPVLFLEQFAAGIPRTYYYQLIDEGGSPFSHYGLVDGNFRPKPAFAALSSLLQLVSGGGGPGTAPDRLAYALDGADVSIHHVLLARRDGRLLLVVWKSAAVFDPSAGAPIAVAPRTLTLRVPRGFTDATVDVYDAGSTFHPVATMRNGAELPLRVGAQPLVVELRLR